MKSLTTLLVLTAISTGCANFSQPFHYTQKDWDRDSNNLTEQCAKYLSLDIDPETKKTRFQVACDEFPEKVSNLFFPEPIIPKKHESITSYD